MSNHTPGPWKFNGHSQSGKSHFNVICTQLGSRFKIARCPYICGCDESEAEANARLIAAAPTMKKQLEQFAMLNENHPDFRSIAGLIINARQILTQLD